MFQPKKSVWDLPAAAAVLHAAARPPPSTDADADRNVAKKVPDVCADEVVGSAIEFRDGAGAWVPALVTAVKLDAVGTASWLELQTHPVVDDDDDAVNPIASTKWKKESEVIVAPGWENVRAPAAPEIQGALGALADVRRTCFVCARVFPNHRRHVRVVADSAGLSKKPRIARDDDVTKRLKAGTLLWCVGCRIQNLQRQMVDPEATQRQRARAQAIATRRENASHTMYSEWAPIAAGPDLPPIDVCRMATEVLAGDSGAVAGQRCSVAGDALLWLVEQKHCEASGYCRGGLDVKACSQGPGGAIKCRAKCRDVACRKMQIVDLSGPKIKGGGRTVGELKANLDRLMSRTPASAKRACSATEGLPAEVGHAPAVDRAFLEHMMPIVAELRDAAIAKAREQCKERGCTRYAADGCWLHPGRTSDYGGEPPPPPQ